MREQSRGDANALVFFFAMALTIITSVLTLHAGLSPMFLVAVLLGASFYGMYAFLAHCDPFTHADYTHNGSGAIAFLVLTLLASAVNSNPFMAVILVFSALVIFETANTFITGSHDNELSLQGLVLTVMAVALTAFIQWRSPTASPEIIVDALNGAQIVSLRSIATHGAILVVLCLPIALSRHHILLRSHGPGFYHPGAPVASLATWGIILGKALTLALAFNLVGVFAGPGYYLMLLLKGRWALAESLALSFLFTLSMTAASALAMPLPSITLSLAASTALLGLYRTKTPGRRRIPGLQ